MSNEMVSESNVHKFLYLFRFLLHSFLVAILAFMIIISIFLFVYLVGGLFYSDDSNSMFRAFIIVSPSMVPTIHINDAIVIKKEKNDNYEVGDVISFSSSDANYQGLTVTHRIVEKTYLNDKESIYVTKGDNNPIVDSSFVKTRDIYGKVLFRIPKIGYIHKYFSDPYHYYICLLIPTLIFIFYDISRIFIAFYKQRSLLNLN